MVSGFAPDPRRKRLRTQALSASGIAVSGDGSVPQRLAIPRAAAVVLHTPHMAGGIQGLLLPEQQRRTLDELTVDLDLRAGDARSKQSAFWTMLVLSAVIASAGILTDSTATVIGAMIIAPLSTPIMGIALGIVKRERIGAGRFVFLGAVVVVLIGVVAALVVADLNL